MTLGRYSGGAVEVQLPVHSLCLFNVQWFMLGRAVCEVCERPPKILAKRDVFVCEFFKQVH